MLARQEDRQVLNARQRTAIELDIAREKATGDVDLRYARKAFEVADAELQRALASVKRFPRSIPQTELDRLKLAAQRAQLQIEQAERDLKLAGLEQQRTANEVDAADLVVERRRIVAPLDGMVVDVYRRAGEWVSPGEAVFRIVRLDRLRVEALLNAREVTRKLLGHRVTLDVPLPGGEVAEFAGEIVFVSPEVEPVSGRFRIWAEVANRDQILSPGLAGTLTVDLRPRAAAASP